MWKVSNIKFLIGATLITSALLLVVAVFLKKQRGREILDYQFNGRVDSVWYSDISITSHDKTKPYVKINGKTYYLFNNWDLGHAIQKGDSLIKERNKLSIILIKRDGRTLTFPDN
jgi:hypothetical protein